MRTYPPGWVVKAQEATHMLEEYKQNSVRLQIFQISSNEQKVH